jgi:hypothetical protein
MQSIRNGLILVCLISCLTSCYRNETCEPLYIGEFRIDPSIISNPKCLEYVKQYNWDTIKLISKDNGKYFFITDDVRLKECEGKWWVSSANVDGDCIGHIKQKNLKVDVSVPPFYIAIQVSGEGYSLPFRKLDSTGNFISPINVDKNQ